MRMPSDQLLSKRFEMNVRGNVLETHDSATESPHMRAHSMHTYSLEAKRFASSEVTLRMCVEGAEPIGSSHASMGASAGLLSYFR